MKQFHRITMPQNRNQDNTCWIITEGMAGTENQCLGITDALGVTPRVQRVTLREPWKTLSPYLGFENRRSFRPALDTPWPDLLITSGRKAIAASRFIKRQSRGKTVTVHIQDPRISSRHFDLVVVPTHDPMRGDNVLVTHASPNRIFPHTLENARHDFPRFKQYDTPLIAMLVGGNSKAYTMTPEITAQLVAHAKTLADKLGATLLITCSRRSGAENMALIHDAFAKSRHYIWDGQGDNPYQAFLAYADYIMVTADSASMISESCTTGKPVFMIPLQGGSHRIDLLHHNLTSLGVLKRFDGDLFSYTYDPLCDAMRVADEIKKRFGLYSV